MTIWDQANRFFLRKPVACRNTSSCSYRAPGMTALACFARYGIKLPRYQQIINHLTWMSHSQNLKRVSREHVIDLYLQPPVGKFRLMDFHLMERLVRDANR